jgi:aminopeptidase N
MIGWQGLAIGGVALALASSAAGFKAGEFSKQAEADKRVEAAIRAGGEKLDKEIADHKVTRSERDQAKAEVEKVNRALAAQVEELRTLLSADQAARVEAAARMEKAAQQAAREARAAGERAREGMEVIRRVADECARAPVPADVKRVLDDILASARPRVVDRSMPAAAGEDRP